MKSTVPILMVILAILVNACQEPKQTPPPDQEEPKKVYIPVSDYIQSQIQSVDSLPVGILKRVISGNRSDSAFITQEEFKRLAAEFLPKELEKENFERSFTESSFMDESTESIAFNYQATEAASPLKRVDVLVSPSLEEDKIKSIYMEKSYSNGDTSFVKKLYWKAGSNFNIITQRTIGQQAAEVEQVKVIWDPLNY